MLYKVLPINKRFKMLFGNFDLHTLHCTQSQVQGNEFPQKESPFSYFRSFVYSQYLSQSSRPRGSSGPGWKPGGSSSGSSSHKEAYETSEKCQATCPSTPLHGPRLKARGNSKWEVRGLRVFINPTATLQPHRRAAPPHCSERPVGHPHKQDRLRACTWLTSFPLYCVQKQNWDSWNKKCFWHGSHYHSSTGNPRLPSDLLTSRASCLSVIL